MSWMMRKRMHQIDLFRKYPHEVQEEWLQKLISTAQNTVFGKRHAFANIQNYDQFKTQVPISKYEDIEASIKTESVLSGHLKDLMEKEKLYLNEKLSKRREYAQFYTEQLSHVKGIQLPCERVGSTPAYHTFIIRTSHRDQLR